jgi:peroxiredoxin Q/BCP
MKTLFLRTAIALVAALLAAALPSTSRAAETPKAGDKAPLIEGKDQDGKAWKLASHAGKTPVLLYFYPKDDTPGCTKQACGLRDRMGDLKKDGVEVVGVSRDSEESHRKFIAKHNLNFTLLADEDGKITAAYGAVMKDRPLSRRVSFLIGKDGRIAHVTDTGAADVHLSEMKDAVARLKP